VGRTLVLRFTLGKAVYRFVPAQRVKYSCVHDEL
jgi:hypothetical protein